MNTFLVADLSNSFLKVALTDGDRIVSERRKLATKFVSTESLIELLEGWVVERAALTSVVPKKTRVFQDYFGDQLKIIDHTSELGVGIEFSDPSRIGGDRLANAAALAELYGYPGVVIDFGSAVTFDIVDARRCYVGGVIAPGLSAMTDYLHEKTALLPRIELRQPDSVIGKTTEEAMLAGAFWGYHGLVRNILDKIRESIAVAGGRTLRIVATGGYAELLREGIPEIEEVNPLITLEGVRIVGRKMIEGEKTKSS